ncbi:MAG: EMC3/TMCO1 family protein [Thermoplasmatales archaeon]
MSDKPTSRSNVPQRPQPTEEERQAMQSTMRTQMLYFVIMILLLFVYTVKGLRDIFAIPMTYILQPIIGFNYSEPIFTILIASLVTGFVNTIARHFYTDYFGIAEIQFRNRKLSERYREAIRTRNKKELDSIRLEQQRYMQQSMKYTTQQMKPTFATLILTVFIFAWLIGFMAHAETLPSIMARSPFGTGSLMHLYFGFYAWIGLYSLFSIVFTYPFQYGLKMLYLRRRVRNEDNYIGSSG